jgi:DNA-binding beta-propeller fold protein YncE
MVPALAAAAVAAGLAFAADDDQQPLRLVQTIALPDLPGPLGRLAADVDSRRLYVAVPQGGSVEVIDLRQGKRQRSLAGFAGPQGIAYASDVKRLFVAGGDDATVKAVHGKTLEIVENVALSPGADPVEYDGKSHELYVGQGGKDAGKDYGVISVLEGAHAQKVAELRTQARPGALLADERSGRVYAVLPDANRLIVVDRKTHAVTLQRTVAGRPVALALDERNRRLFVGTRNPPKIVVLDTTSGKEVANLQTIGVLDGLFYDADRKRVYASGGEGYVDVQQQVDADHYEPLTRVATGPGARTSLYVPDWKQLFVAVPGTGNGPGQILVFEARK